MRANKILTAVVILQGLLLLGQWTGQSTPAAHAARGEISLPDPGARELAMIEELKSLNAKMDKLHATLQSGEVQVKVRDDAK